MRTGLRFEKLGMSFVYDDAGNRTPVTLLALHECHVVAVKTLEKDKYTAVQLGVVSAKPKNVSKAMKGHFAKANVPLKREVFECRVSEDELIEVGSVIGVNHFIAGQHVDVTGTTIGKGFAGVMKRHNFRGLEASHGVSVSHRSHGSTGQRQDPGKVFKNKKMAGHMGCVKVTTQNLEVISADVEQGLLVIKGAVPGSKGSFVTVRDAIKFTIPRTAPYPAAIISVNDGNANAS